MSLISLLGLTTWTGLSPRTTIMITIPWPILLFLLHALLDKEPIGKEMAPVNNDQNPPEEDKLLASRQTILFSDRLHVTKHIFPYILFLFITYFTEYLSNHAIITTLAFPNAPFNPRDHYPYYLLPIMLANSWAGHTCF